MEYASSCWSPNSEKQNKMLEMVQHSAAKFVTNRYPKKGHYEEFSISDIIHELEWDTLEVRRNRAKLSMAYKILHGHVILSSDSLPKANISRPRQCNEVLVGRENQLKEPESRGLLTSNKTFFFSVPKIWNDTVTASQAGAPSVDAFRNYFRRKKWYLFVVFVYS